MHQRVTRQRTVDLLKRATVSYRRIAEKEGVYKEMVAKIRRQEHLKLSPYYLGRKSDQSKRAHCRIVERGELRTAVSANEYLNSHLNQTGGTNRV